MKSFRQQFRQPIKFIAGLILMTVAAAIVCVCVGQALAARNTAKALDEQFTTVVLPVGEGLQKHWWSGYAKPQTTENFNTWLEEAVVSRSDVVKTVAEHGLISAHIPELTPLNFTQGDYISDAFSGEKRYWYYQPSPDGIPYSSAMLAITLDEISEPVEELEVTTKQRPHVIEEFAKAEHYWNWYAVQEKETIPVGYRISLVGTVTEVVSLQEGYRDPTGMTARLTMTAKTREELETLDLQPGETYLVYGMDYYDEDWALRGYLADERNEIPLRIDTFDMRKLRRLTEEESSRYVAQYNLNSLNPPVAMYDGRVFLNQEQVNQINSISLTMETPAPLLRYSVVRDEETGYFQRFLLQKNMSYTNRNGETTVMTDEEYIDRYMVPTITRLEGSVEDFLQSEEGIPWREALERDEVNHHAFAILGVDRAMYLAWFAQEEARIIHGRDFTEGELRSGAKVCILHERVAAASGLEVGETITLNFYHGDPGLPYQDFRDDEAGLLAPAADFYFKTTPVLETAEYTIVGTYRSWDLWVDVALNEYGLSPNTAIIPKTSVETALEYPQSILFKTVVLHNGKQEEFLTLAKEAGYEKSFAIYDQGYTDIADNFHNYDALVQQILTVGASVYAVILLLFLILFPGTQKKIVMTMESLGATRGKCFAHVLLSSAAIAAPATVLGGAIGMLLWQRILDALQASAESAVVLQLEISTLPLLALAQFIFAMVLTAIIAAWVTAPKGMSKRRSK